MKTLVSTSANSDWVVPSAIAFANSFRKYSLKFFDRTADVASLHFDRPRDFTAKIGCESVDGTHLQLHNRSTFSAKFELARDVHLLEIKSRGWKPPDGRTAKRKVRKGQGIESTESQNPLRPGRTKAVGPTVPKGRQTTADDVKMRLTFRLRPVDNAS